MVLKNLTTKTKRRFRKIDITKPLFPGFLVLGIAAIIVLLFSLRFWIEEPSDFFRDVLVEAHGMLMDILIFTILIVFINVVREKRLKIERYKEEIDDYRNWNEMTASYRLAGILRRISRYEVKELNLSDCNLKNGRLPYIFLEKANLAYTVLEEANLYLARCHGAIFYEANLKGANLRNADLRNAVLRNAVLWGLNSESVPNRASSIINEPSNARTLIANLKNADLTGADLTGAKIKIGQYKGVRSLEGATMPDGTKYNEEWEIKIKNAKELKYKDNYIL